MCSPEYIEFVCAQLKGLGVVRSRKMMGDYVIYVDEKCVITACDEVLMGRTGTSIGPK